MTMFVVWATDRAGALPARQRVREAHRARLRAPQPHAVQVLLAGPTFDDAQQMNGTMLVVQADDRAVVQAFIDDDPYVAAGVYGFVEIRPWHCGLGSLAPSP
ncbi:MAG: YciI family protein [Burkholderiales bacterium]|nr:YciI family protein [Burkholderiales bacterium]